MGGNDDRRTEWRESGLARALGLTLASAVVWGIAHLYTGRRRVGYVLLAAFAVIFGVLGISAALFVGNDATRSTFIQYAVSPGALAAIGVGLVLVAMAWACVIVWSYRLSRPEEMPRRMGTIGGFAVTAMCLSVTAPLVYAAHTAYAQRDLVNSLFPSSGTEGQAAKVWKGRSRVNIMLLGGDAGPGRMGVRTDSVTIASIDTKTANTVLFSLPRNLENVPMRGALRKKFPRGFGGNGDATPGILNEIWQYAEENPRYLPGVPDKQRGPRVLKAAVSDVLGIPVDNYVLVDMAGFAGIVDAIGGVRLKVEKPIPYGARGETVKPGDRRLSGIEAMWYGRYRSDGSDYNRMSRQKCLLREIAKQANPAKVLTKFNRLAQATKRAMATDIPAGMLPPLIELSVKVKEGADIRSLQFVPPTYKPAWPNYPLIRQRVATAIQQSESASGKNVGIATSLDLACG